MWPDVTVLVCLLVLQSRRCAADLCNWTGSGFAAGVDSRIVLQVRLRCTEGSVRWVYPGQALRVVLEPNLSTNPRTAVCIKPSPSFRGASVFVERAGELELLATEGERPRQQVFCFRADGAHRPAIYLQASPRSDGHWGRRTMGFRYELLGNWSAAPNLGLSGLQTSCRPCNDTELLMAVCNSDFVVRGHIKNISHDSESQTSLVEVSAGRVYRQRSGVFERRAAPGSPQSASPWHGHIHAPLQCGVKPGDGEFLFTGSEHFGEAWLGCAPRYKDFLSVYQTARAAHRNSCDFPLD